MLTKVNFIPGITLSQPCDKAITVSKKGCHNMVTMLWQGCHYVVTRLQTTLYVNKVAAT